MVAIRRHIREFEEDRRMFGLWGAIGELAFLTGRNLFPGTYRRKAAMDYFSLSEQATSWVIDENKLLAALGIDEGSQTRFSEEFAELSRVLVQRSHPAPRPYPEYFKVESGTARIIYTVARHFRPLTVLETGVANGHSTYFLLHALEKNGEGQLHSIDIANDVAGVLTDEERRSWKLHLLDCTEPYGSLREILETIPPIDFFLHDSDHSYRGLWRELTALRPHLAPGAVVAADDTDASWAFPDFCRELGLPLHVLFDRIKLFAVTKLSEHRTTHLTQSTQ